MNSPKPRNQRLATQRDHKHEHGTLNSTALSRIILSATVAVSLLAFGVPSAQATNVAVKAFEGAWSSTASYSAGTVVTYDKASYIALTSNLAANPTSNTSDWAILDAPGATGPVGPAGAKGATGVQGPQVHAGVSQGVFGFLSPGTFTFNLTQGGRIVATTNPISISGDYYINATAVVLPANDDSVWCYAATGEFGNYNDGFDGGAAILDVWVVNAGDVTNLYCFSKLGYGGSGVNSAFITATLINVDNGETDSSLRNRTTARLLDKKQIQNSQVNAHLSAHR